MLTKIVTSEPLHFKIKLNICIVFADNLANVNKFIQKNC